MVQYEYRFRCGRTLDYAILTAAACLSLYLCVRPALKDKPRPPRTLRAKARDAAQRLPNSSAALPYPADAFPGARDVETEYGTIKVFEWGPEAGKKVLLMHGIGTPCVALGDMAREFVRRGCRVMLFGECFKLLLWLYLAPTESSCHDRLLHELVCHGAAMKRHLTM